MRVVFLAIVVVALAACNKAPQDVVPDNSAATLPAVAPPTPAPATTTDEASPMVASGATMTITPLKTDNCEPKKYTAEISWVIPPALAFSGAEVRVGKPDGGLLAFKKQRTYTQKSGPWVGEGTKFFIVDKDSRQILAQAEAPAYDCL